MLSETEFRNWATSLNLTPQAIRLIEQIRTSNPVRIIHDGPYNTPGRYSSKKMGLTIQAESHSVERSAILIYEHDPDVLEYYDQPCQIKLNYVRANGTKAGIWHTPDFFVIRKHEAGWEEWKPDERLEKLAEKEPNRYCRQGRKWLCPPGQAYAESYGLYYRLRVKSELHPIYLRNLEFLSHYLQYPYTVPGSVKDRVLSHLYQNPGTTLYELLATSSDIPSDAVYTLIAQNDIYMDWYAECLADAEYVHLYPSRDVAEALTILTSESTPPRVPLQISLTAGSAISWDGIVWTIFHVGQTEVTLQREASDDFRILKIDVFEKLVARGSITGVPLQDAPVNHYSSILSGTHPDALREALRRYEILKQYWKTHNNPDPNVSLRTIRRWERAFRLAEEVTGYGFDGLIPGHARKGNRTRKIPEELLSLMQSTVEETYEVSTNPSMFASYRMLQARCTEAGIPAPSYVTFVRFLKRRPKHQQERKRKGEKIAMRYEVFEEHLARDTPRHGDRPFQICHIDHTQLDILLVSRRGQVLGRPWLTLAIDAYSRRILGFDVDFDEPSYRSLMRVVRDIVRRYHRMPDQVVVDGGKEFQSVYFEQLLARFQCEKTSRKGKPRNGNVIERLFGSTHAEFIYQLQGNTQLLKNVRQITDEVNPERLAVWTLEALNDALESYFFTAYDQKRHPALGQSPREAYEVGIAITGERPARIVPYNRDFVIMTCSSTPKGTSKIEPGRGIKVNGIYYWNEEFRSARWENERVPVRYDPDNMGIAFAYLDGRWLECCSYRYSVFRNRTEKEVRLAARLHKRLSHRGSPTQRQLVDAILQAKDTELELQRARDEERLRKGQPTFDNRISDSPLVAGFPDTLHPEDQSQHEFVIENFDEMEDL